MEIRDDIADRDEFRRCHPAGFCRRPIDGDSSVVFRVPGRFQAPREIDLRDYCTPTEDQGESPMCSAFAAAGWAENILWRKTDAISEVSPERVYGFAKMVDGMPDVSGTTITAALGSLKALGLFGTECAVRTIPGGALGCKYAIHKFGCVVAGFNLSSDWWDATLDSDVIRGCGEANQGAHAVLLCGYSKDGVYLQNSWGKGWGRYGFAKLTWDAYSRQIVYGAVLENCLNGLKVT